MKYVKQQFESKKTPGKMLTRCLPVFDEDFERRASGMTLDNPGFCLACGNEQEGCEPDAERYNCEACDRPMVFGFQQLVIMGLIVTDVTPEMEVHEA